MRKMKRGVALLLVLALLATLVVAASYNWRDAELGDLSQYYETGSVGKEKAQPGYISTVSGDSGGTSYGVYMFASNAGTPYEFAKWLKGHTPLSLYWQMGEVLTMAYEYNRFGQYSPGYGSNFNAKWKRIAETWPEEFFEAQKAYWRETNYNKLIANIQAQYPALSLDNYSIALKNVFWSRSVQNGVSGATRVITNAINGLGGFKNQSEETLINAIYAECSKLDAVAAAKKMSGSVASKYGVNGKSMAYFSANSGDVQISVYRRLHVNEPADAVVMLYQNQGWTMPNGVYQIRSHNNQSQGIVGGVLGPASSADLFTLTNFESGYVTLNAGDKRLTDKGGVVAPASADAGNNQMWKIEGNTLKNRGTGGYLAANESGELITVSSAAKATPWQFSAQAKVQGIGLFYPGCEKNVTNQLVAKSSSFPIRGVITSAKNITNITVKVTGSGTGFTASAAPNANWYDLWNLDSKCTFSSLSKGDYTLVITATAGGETTELARSKFSVAANTGNVGDDETFTVTFDAKGGGSNITRTYKLGDVYGELPQIDKSGFVGWFLEDGTEINASTPVAAKNHTLIAKYGAVYTVTFLKENGATLKTLQLAEGELITAPTNPVKAADGSYTYSFSYWQDGAGNKFVSDETYMGTENITYTPVFTKSDGTSGGTETDSGYLKGLVPNTGVSALTDSGYKVYNSDGSSVTGGNLATGMTATSAGTTVTVVVTGDVNGDGKLTITDVVKLQSHVVGKNALSGAFAKAGDLNGDGSITITDVVQAAQVTVGKRSLS